MSNDLNKPSCNLKFGSSGRKILFLDHTGVMRLSSQPRYKEFHQSKMIDGKMVVVFDDFDQGCVEVLNSILISNLSIEIVVSSDWRCFVDLEEMGEFYLKQGICRKPVDYTPHIVRSHLIEKNRVLEIQAWLDQHSNVDRWVAIDDLDLRFGLSNFVWVNCSELGIKQSGIREEILGFLG